MIAQNDSLRDLRRPAKGAEQKEPAKVEDAG